MSRFLIKLGILCLQIFLLYNFTQKVTFSIFLYFFRSLEKFLFGKVSSGGFKISSSSESESEGEEEETSKQKSQWSSTIEASKTSKDSDSDDSGVDENDKGKLITQFSDL